MGGLEWGFRLEGGRDHEYQAYGWADFCFMGGQTFVLLNKGGQFFILLMGGQIFVFLMGGQFFVLLNKGGHICVVPMGGQLFVLLVGPLLSWVGALSTLS